MGFNNPSMPWSELERPLSGGRRSAVPTGRERRRQPGLVAQAPALRAPPSAVERPRGAGALRRAALPLQLQLPRRRLATPRSWSRRRPGSGSRPWPSPTTTASTAWSASPRRPARSGLPTVFGAELTLDAARAARQRRPADPRGRATCWCWPATPTGYARLARRSSARRSWRGEKGQPRLRSPMRRAGRAGHGGHWLVLTGCRKGTVPAALVDDGPAAAARELRRPGRPRSAASNVAVELWDHGDPLDSARNDALAELAAAAGRRRGGHQQRPLRHPGRAGRWPPRWPRCGPGAASTRSTAGCPAAAGAHLRSGAEQARRFARYPGVVERAAELGLELRLRPARWSPRTCRRSRAPTGLDEMSCLRQLTEQGADRSATARASAERVARRLRADRPRARPDRARSASPATSWSCGTSSSSAAGRTSSARAGARPPTRRSATPSASPTPTRCARPAVRAVPLARARRPARHRHRHRERPAGGGHPVRLRALRPRARRPGGQRHHLPGQVGGPRHGQGARLRARPAGRVVASRSTAWGRCAATAGQRPTTTSRAAGARAGRRRSSTSPATSASTRAAW